MRTLFLSLPPKPGPCPAPSPAPSQILDGDKYLWQALGSGLWPIMVLVSEIVQVGAGWRAGHRESWSCMWCQERVHAAVLAPGPVR